MDWPTPGSRAWTPSCGSSPASPSGSAHPTRSLPWPCSTSAACAHPYPAARSPDHAHGSSTRAPFLDEPQDPLVRDAMLDEPPHPSVVDGVVEPTDVSIEYPVHLPLLDPDRQRIQCIVRAAPGPETIREGCGSSGVTVGA